MRLLLAIFLPFLSFCFIGRPLAAIWCLILQITLIGWLPAALWAIFALGQWKTDQKIRRALKTQTVSPTSEASAAQAIACVAEAPKAAVPNERAASKF